MNTAFRNRFISDGVAAISQERLLLALYDRLLADLDQATAAIGANDLSTAHDMLVHAQQILEELHLAIDTSVWPEGERVAALYLFARDQLVQANVRKDALPVRQVRSIVAPLADTWREAFDQMTASRSMTPTPALAGAFELGA